MLSALTLSCNCSYSWHTNDINTGANWTPLCVTDNAILSTCLLQHIFLDLHCGKYDRISQWALLHALLWQKTKISTVPSKIQLCHNRKGGNISNRGLHHDTKVNSMQQSFSLSLSWSTNSPPFITMFTRAHHWSLSWATCIQSTPSYPISQISILILSCHLHIDLVSGEWSLPSRFSNQNVVCPKNPSKSKALCNILQQAAFLQFSTPKATGTPLTGCPQLLTTISTRRVS
jgi:hypothetical protein